MSYTASDTLANIGGIAVTVLVLGVASELAYHRFTKRYEVHIKFSLRLRRRNGNE